MVVSALAINLALTHIVALAANLLASFRHLALPRTNQRRGAETAAVLLSCTFPPG